MKNRPLARPDFATFAGLAIAIGGIIGGLVAEKGSVLDLAQLTALLIVAGGTAGAVMISTPGSILWRAVKRSRQVFFRDATDDRVIVETLVGLAVQARRRGVVFMDRYAQTTPDPFLRQGLMLAADGVDTKEIRRQMELELRILDDAVETDARVFEMAGGYAPTVGIIGAVLGLIQVMKHLTSIGDVGKGIAVAFVATVYGVGAANLLLLPAGAKIRQRERVRSQTRELILEGVLGIAEGLNPHLVRTRLETFLADRGANARTRPEDRPEAGNKERPAEAVPANESA